MNSNKEEAEPARRRLSCTKYFDALWFCYSINVRVVKIPPVHQLQQYYRLGTLDNCSEKWSALFDCLSLKTKRVSEVEEILETREKSKQHIWSFRSPQEARSHWDKLFGHLDGQE
ncbi:hypothetical protein ACJIZ3_017333 [Penstemon smallii]|uniref:Uncharacterized protein n=1 Tax=Penstemon smallii TaxID=265156 RepID=A0ABD3SV78_9LAMI